MWVGLDDVDLDYVGREGEVTPIWVYAPGVQVLLYPFC